MAPDTESRVFETLLDEYKIQRTAESERVQRSQHTVTFGGATIGILIAAGFNIWEQVLPATLIFLVVVPLVSTAVAVQWVGLMRSYVRTHQYVNALERAIKAKLGGEAPSDLFAKHTPGREAWFQSAGMAVFGLLAAGSIVLGVYKAHHHKALVLTFGTAEFIALLIVALLLMLSLQRLRRDPKAFQGGTAVRQEPSPEHQAASPQTLA